MAGTLHVRDAGEALTFGFDDLMRYHGPRSPGGVAHAFKVLQRALPLLDRFHLVERRELYIRTAFGGPGARDGFEMVTRAVTGDRYVVDASLARPDLGRAREQFVFVITYRDAEVTLVLREGFVREELLDLAATKDRTVDQEERLDDLKRELAERTMAHPAADVYDVVDVPARRPEHRP